MTSLHSPRSIESPEIDGCCRVGRTTRLYGSTAGNFAEFRPILTTDFSEFATSSNHLAQEGCGVEMGDAALGMVCEELGAQAPRWLVVRNASDPQITGDLPTSPDVQTMWAVWFCEQYGYWTSLSSAIACWAVIAGDHG